MGTRLGLSNSLTANYSLEVFKFLVSACIALRVAVIIICLYTLVPSFKFLCHILLLSNESFDIPCSFEKILLEIL